MSRDRHPGFSARAALALTALVAALAAWLAAAAPARAACPNAPVLVSSDPGSDGVINDDSPTFTGTALEDPCTAGSEQFVGTIQLLRRPQSLFPPGGSFAVVASASTGPDGTAQLTDTTNPADGAWEYKLSAEGDLGIFTTRIVIDTTLATPAEPALTIESDTGDLSSDGLTSDATPTFSGTTEGGASVQLRRGGIDVGAPAGAAPGGAWAATDPGASGTARCPSFCCGLAVITS